MKWTTKLSVSPGFYWLRLPGSRAQIISVFEIHGKLFFSEHGFRGTHPVSYLNSSYVFFGPIKEPE